MTLPPILTPRDIAAELQASEDLIRAMANRGEIPGAFRVGKLWRFHRDLAMPRLAPRPDTLPAQWQDAEEHPSQSQSAPQEAVGGASVGANTASNAKSAATRPKTKRKTAHHRSEHAFAAVFPADPKPSRYAS